MRRLERDLARLEPMADRCYQLTAHRLRQMEREAAQADSLRLRRTRDEFGRPLPHSTVEYVEMRRPNQAEAGRAEQDQTGLGEIEQAPATFDTPAGGIQRREHPGAPGDDPPPYSE